MLPQDGDLWCHYHLVGDKGGINFTFTIDPSSTSNKVLQGWDVGVHHKEEHEYYQQMNNCMVIGCDKCWYEGSGLLAKEWLNVLKEKGSDAIWELMEEHYKYYFK